MIRVANRDANVVKERRENGELTHSASKVEGHWEVAYFAGDTEVALVLVDPHGGEVTESWTGYQVLWKMARGYSGAFGHKLNAPYVFLPLCALFLVGLLDWRRPWRVATLDLLVLLGFGVSNYFFNRAEIGVSVPLQYPALLYLLGRALWIGLRGRGEGIRPVWRASWLLVAALFLMGFRVGLNMADSGAIDVGYAGVVGADRITHGEPLYENFPSDVSQGDTYGPVNYIAYVPFEAIWPWTGAWNDLPAAHGAAVAFDLMTFALLIWLGLRIRPGPSGRKLAATLAFGWAAYPYTAYALESNSNDTLVAALLVATLLALSRPIARGAVAALATLTKFAPVLLAPMLATYSPAGGGAAVPHSGGRRRRPSRLGRSAVTGPAAWAFGASFLLTIAVLMAWLAIDPGLHTFYDRTIAYQADRDSPFSIWGQVGGLEPLRIAILAATGILALAFAFVPQRKSLVQVAALAAALLIALQLVAQHWFYLYIVWFYPLLLVAMTSLASELEEGGIQWEATMPDGKGDSYTDIDRATARSESWLLRNQDPHSGGWAERKGEPPSALNTAEVLLAFGQLRDKSPMARESIRRAVDFMGKHQTNEGPEAGAWFRYVADEPRCPDLPRTALAVEALIAVSDLAPAASSEGVRWILSVRNDDGGWGYRRGADSAVLPTCFALSALLAATAGGLEVEKRDNSIEDAFAFLLGRQQAGGSFGNPGRLSGARTAFAALCLQRGEGLELSTARSAREDAVAWLEANPVPALTEVEESIEIDPDRDHPRGDYGFLFFSKALVARVMSESPDPEKQSGQLAQEAMEALFKAMTPDGGFFGQRVFSWSTARAMGALRPTPFTEFPEAPRPTEPRRVGNVILAFLVLVLVSVVILSATGGFGAAQAAVFTVLVLAALLGYGLISEAGFLTALRSALPSFRGGGRQ